MDNKLIEFKLVKCTMFLYSEEILPLLPYLPEEIKIKALKRGKAILRVRKFQEREIKRKEEQCYDL